MEKDEILIFFHLIRHSFVMTPSPQGEGFELAFFKKVEKNLTKANSLLRFFFDTQGAKKKA